MLNKLFPAAYADSVYTIDYAKLYEKGYRGIILDIDNTLVHHGDPADEKITALFDRIRASGLKTVLLSDNELSRVQPFAEAVGSPFVCDADKPSKSGYSKALAVLGLDKRQVICAGDQLILDVRGANRSGMDCILVHFIEAEGETELGQKRYFEYGALRLWEKTPLFNRLGDIYQGGKNRPFLRSKPILFCDINDTTYAISEAKEKAKRYYKDFTGNDRFAVKRTGSRLPNVVSTYSSHLIKKGKGIDPTLQRNKAVNIKIAADTMNGMVIMPGETFSFWRTVGKITAAKGYRDGRIISGGKLEPGLGGGLCNLANTIHNLILHSPLEVTEFHSHSDALAPDGAKRVPFSSGTSVCYNYIDYRFKNTTDQPVQLCVWCEKGELRAELRSRSRFPYTFELAEEDHHFTLEEDGKYYRISKIYKVTRDRESGRVIAKDLVRDNHSEVMYDYSEIPRDLIR
ncbi:vancomycin resistance protein VanW [Ruminococcus sp. YE71]|uniref:VanW family protein n=1 Tax=unclassified Ruminococcus TaxID=2608920 RepID=UPI000883382E|nr:MULTISPECIES: VanW family protein [unclassified Ruminococcus]SDA11633.1 vancomycin resistance protein VanW [Ruminococcus sp. YE78]SFW15538.1 vancomycin resistance protein VanW [Ruminococcus sp. YE71]